MKPLGVRILRLPPSLETSHNGIGAACYAVGEQSLGRSNRPVSANFSFHGITIVVKLAVNQQYAGATPACGAIGL